MTNQSFREEAAGWSPGYGSHPLFDPRYYLDHCIAEPAAFEAPGLHFASIGWRQSSNPHPLFDVRYYASQVPELLLGYEDPLSHYMRIGAANGLDPHPLFNTTYYAAQIGELGDCNPLVHFLDHALDDDARSPSRFFNLDYYRTVYPDVVDVGVNPLVHYVEFGVKEGRRPDHLFEPKFYRVRRQIGADADPLCDFVARLKLLRSTRVNAPSVPRVSAILLNYGKSFLTIQAVVELLSDPSVSGDLEVIVVDNGSSADEFDFLARTLPACVRLIRLGQNRFFGEGNNIAVEEARAPYVLFLNNDAFVTPESIGKLLAVFDTFEDAGATGPKFLYPDGRIQEAGGSVSPCGAVLQRGKGLANEPGRFERQEAVQYISAACLMMPRELFLEVGGFDLVWEPAYYEDVDLCLKIKIAGKKTYYTPDATVYHIENATSSEVSFGLRLDSVVAINREKFISRWGAFLEDSTSVPPAVLLPSARRERGRRVRDAVLFSPYPLYPGGGERYLLSIASMLSETHNVFVTTPERYSTLRLATMAREFDLDLDAVKIDLDADVEATHPHPEIFLSMCNGLVPDLRPRGDRSYFLCQFPFPLAPEVLARSWAGVRNAPYDMTIVYSEFVAENVRRQAAELGIPTPPIVVIPPPVPQMPAGFRDPTKPLRILNVGRFSPGGHCKRQDVLIAAFRQLRDNFPNLELHLVGPVPADASSRDYVRELRDLAAGEPIFFHHNVPAAVLRDQYASATMYWHATGANESVRANPERFEHFGISILEAMSAGATPFVVGEGGAREFIDHGGNGFMWHRGIELVEYSSHFLRFSPETRHRLSEAARQTATAFAEDRFKERVLPVLLRSEEARLGSQIGGR